MQSVTTAARDSVAERFSPLQSGIWIGSSSWMVVSDEEPELLRYDVGTSTYRSFLTFSLPTLPDVQEMRLTLVGVSKYVTLGPVLATYVSLIDAEAQILLSSRPVTELSAVERWDLP